MAGSPSQLPSSGPPNSDNEEFSANEEILSPLSLGLMLVILALEISKKLIVANRNSTVEHIKALIEDKEKINDEYSKQLFFGGRPLEEGRRLADYGIRGHATIRVLLQDLARMTVIVHIQSAQKYLLLDARNQDTDDLSHDQAMEGILPDDFALFSGGEAFAEDWTLASLNLPPELTFYLLLHPKEHLSIFVNMSSCKVRVDTKFWFLVGHVKALAIAKMCVRVMHSHFLYHWEQLEDHKTLACYGIVDGFVFTIGVSLCSILDICQLREW
ncbi:hypothetical protein ACJRO7_031258 [Eucalyptus globulus]|uniref:Ubiquitin-like domain-containing protein n=1 Tax=Eucalyptus globulus TaxID=34317 RepID=A0ABD3JJ90_EUCGL